MREREDAAVAISHGSGWLWAHSLDKCGRSDPLVRFLFSSFQFFEPAPIFSACFRIRNTVFLDFIDLFFGQRLSAFIGNKFPADADRFSVIICRFYVRPKPRLPSNLFCFCGCRQFYNGQFITAI